MLDEFYLISNNRTEMGGNTRTELLEEGGIGLGLSFRNSQNFLGLASEKLCV